MHCLICTLLNSACSVFFKAFLSSADYFQNQLFRKFLSGIPSECQMVWILIRPDVLSGLIWVKTICKDHQQTTNNIDHIQSLNQSLAIQGGMCYALFHMYAAKLFACWVFFKHFCRLLIFFKINFFEKFFQEYHQSVKWFGS